MFAAGFDWNVPIAVAATGAFALAGGGAVRSWWISKRSKADSDNDRLRRVEEILAGRSYDPVTNMPGTNGFIRNFEDFQEYVRHELTLNGGGTVKDELAALRRTVAAIAQKHGVSNEGTRL